MTTLTALAGNDITDAFRSCGVTEGGTLMLHGDAMVAAQLAGGLPSAKRLDVVIDAVLAALGPSGTLVMPTFTYSFTRGENFDPAASPSTVGALTEHFRRRPGVLRSENPLFSVAAFGRLAPDFAAARVDDCFGPGSAFDLLFQNNGMIGCLGCGFDRITFTHYVEQSRQVEYRYVKHFTGSILRHGKPESAIVEYLVRDLNRETQTDLARLKERLDDTGRLRSAAVGRVGLMVVMAKDFFDAAVELMNEDPSALIREGARRA